jgi:hypothetical protein
MKTFLTRIFKKSAADAYALISCQLISLNPQDGPQKWVQVFLYAFCALGQLKSMSRYFGDFTAKNSQVPVR